MFVRGAERQPLGTAIVEREQRRVIGAMIGCVGCGMCGVEARGVGLAVGTYSVIPYSRSIEGRDVVEAILLSVKLYHAFKYSKGLKITVSVYCHSVTV